MDSILQTSKECFFCGREHGLHKHHIVFGTANRKNSEKYGVWVWLCPPHHNMSNESVHSKREMAEVLIVLAQKKFEEIHSHEMWMDVFGRSWI